jgi:pimeloyl-ACP methyl ester carboxylesterase
MRRWSPRKKLALGLLFVAFVACAIGFVSFVLQPFWYFERLGKLLLRNAGLERATLDGPRGRLIYFRGGSGETLVLIHGANDQAGAWSLVARPLVQGRRLLVPDLPGHGESEPRRGSLGPADLIAGVERLLDAEVGSGRATLLGNSLGGWLALVYAARHPERVAHVILLNGAAIRSAPAVGISLLPKTREEAARALDMLTDPATPRAPGFVLDAMVRRAPVSPLARLYEAPVDESLFLDDRLQGLRIPVSLIWGESDRLMPPAYAEETRARLPAARVELLPRCGHVPQRECPEAAVAAIERALREPPAAGPKED